MLKKIFDICQIVPDYIYNWLIFLYRKPNYIEKPQIHGKIYMVTDRGKINFGRQVEINSSLKSNPISGLSRTVLFVASGGRISIGNNVGISNSNIIAYSEIIIEDDVMIGSGCRIYDSDFHSIDYNERIIESDSHIKTGSVHIKKGAFIGASCIILKGVTIGERAVIGAGSVVTRNIPDMEMWAGNPARFIRKLVC